MLCPRLKAYARWTFGIIKARTGLFHLFVFWKCTHGVHPKIFITIVFIIRDNFISLLFVQLHYLSNPCHLKIFQFERKTYEDYRYIVKYLINEIIIQLHAHIEAFLIGIKEEATIRNFRDKKNSWKATTRTFPNLSYLSLKEEISLDSSITNDESYEIFFLLYTNFSFFFNILHSVETLESKELFHSRKDSMGKWRRGARYSRLENRRPLLNASRRHTRGNWSRANSISTFHDFPSSIHRYLNKSIRRNSRVTLQRQWGRLETASIYAFAYRTDRDWTLLFDRIQFLAERREPVNDV